MRRRPPPRTSRGVRERKAGQTSCFTAFGGDGIRFNNPYRLATVLGSQAQSLSRTASYADTGVALLLSDPTRLTAGFAVRVSFALEGVQQAVMTPSFLLLHRWSEWGICTDAPVCHSWRTQT